MADTSKNGGTFESKLTTVHDVTDLYPLVGFGVTGLKSVDGDGIYISLENGRNCAVDVLYDGKFLHITAPYGIDRGGNRI